MLQIRSDKHTLLGTENPNMNISQPKIIPNEFFYLVRRQPVGQSISTAAAAVGGDQDGGERLLRRGGGRGGGGCAGLLLLFGHSS